MQSSSKTATRSNGRHRQPAAKTAKAKSFPGVTTAALTLTASGAVIVTGIGGPAAADEGDLTAALNLLGKKPAPPTAPENSGLLAGPAQSDRESQSSTSRSSLRVERTGDLIEELQKSAQTEQERRARAEAAAKASRAKERAELEAKQKAAIEAAQRWVLPVSGYRITATFGSSGSRWSQGHTGDDFAVPTGSRVGSLSTGTIIGAGWDGAYGYKVEIRHWDGTVSWYCHLTSISVNVGEDVTPGEEIGRSGSTGNSTGPHLHLEIHPKGGAAVSPRSWLADRGIDV